MKFLLILCLVLAPVYSVSAGKAKVSKESCEEAGGTWSNKFRKCYFL